MRFTYAPTPEELDAAEARELAALGAKAWPALLETLEAVLQKNPGVKPPAAFGALQAETAAIRARAANRKG